MYFCLLILCGFLCEGIVQVLSEDVVRRKRVVNEDPDGDIPVQNGVAPYVVNIKGFPGNMNICVGSILSKRTVITAAGCVIHYDLASIKIQVGSSYSFLGTVHTIKEKKVRIADHPLNARDGIALLILEHAIIFNSKTRPIALHQGTLFADTPATIFGWGHNFGIPHGTNYRHRLRSITLPIMDHRRCVDIYRNRAVISDKHICIYSQNKRCGNTDSGAPLVVNNELAGIYIYTGTDQGHPNPDVFLIVQDIEYELWIRNNIVH